MRRHNRFAGAGIVSQQKSYTGDLQKVVINGFELMRQRIDARDGKTELRIKLVGDAERISLEPEAEKLAVAVVALGRILNRERARSLAVSVTLRNLSD